MCYDTEVNEETAEILESLEAGNYDVSYEAPNCFCERTKPNGDVFYVIRGDDARFGCDYGSTTVTVCGYEFTWNPIEGEWEGLDEDIDPDGEIADVLNGLDDVTRLSDCPDTEELSSFYELATGESIEAYYYEDPDVPVDAEDVCSPKDAAVDTVAFGGKEYYLVEDPEQDEYDGDVVFRATAIAEGTEADENGCFECVCVLMSADQVDEESEEYECGEPFAVEDSNSTYNGVGGELE